jgi:hypothetical protein
VKCSLCDRDICKGAQRVGVWHGVDSWLRALTWWYRCKSHCTTSLIASHHPPRSLVDYVIRSPFLHGVRKLNVLQVTCSIFLSCSRRNVSAADSSRSSRPSPSSAPVPCLPHPSPRGAGAGACDGVLEEGGRASSCAA